MAIVAFMFVACSKPSVNQPIFDRAYSLYQDGEYKMSEEYLNNHQSELVQPLTDADSIYAILLHSMYKAHFMLFDINGIDDSLTLDRCIRFYREAGDHEKEAWALYARSVKSLQTNGIIFLRQAEDIAKTLNNNELSFHLAFLRYSIEGQSFDLGAFGMQLVDNMLRYARTIDQKAQCYTAKAITFYLIGTVDSTLHYMLDSVSYYMDKCAKIDTSNYNYLAFYGFLFADKDPEKSLRYALKAAEINPWNVVGKMSRIRSYLALNQPEKAEQFFAESEFYNENVLIPCIDLYNYYTRIGDLQNANRHAADVITQLFEQSRLAPSYRYVLDNKRKYDLELLSLANRSRTQRIIFGGVLLFVVAISLLSTVLVRQRRRHEQELDRNRQILKESHDKIEELRMTDKSAENEREIARLQRKIADIESRYAEIYNEGRKLYNDIFVHNGNSGQWAKKDYEKFLEYYKTLDLSLIAQIEDDYDRLNPRQTFYRILVEKGYDKERIMQIMAIQEDGTLRALKSKVESAKRPERVKDAG